MDKNISISVIVPCYNQGAFIAETLNSVIAQTYTNWECIVIDDGSSDNSSQIAKEFCKKDTRIKYIYQQNSGVSVARNNGIAHAKGEFILPLDADDLIAPKYIEKAINIFSEEPDVKLVYCKAELFGATTGKWNLPEYRYEDLLWRNLIFCSAVFSKADYEKTNGYNSNMKLGLEDWDFWLSFLSSTDKVICIDEVLFFYRIKQKSRTTSANQHIDKLNIQIYQNHKELYLPFCKEIIKLHNQCEMLKNECNSLKNSFSYRLGKAILFLPRHFKKIIKK